MASAPRSAPTVRSSMMVSVAGSAPERSSSACSWVCWVVNWPVMMPLPPQIALCTTGALMISLSSWIASRLPMFGAGGGAEGAAAGGVEGEGDDRPAALLLLEGRLGVVEILAAHDHALEHRQALRLVAPADLLGRESRVGVLDVLVGLGIGRAQRLHALARRHQEGGRRQVGRQVLAGLRHVLVHQMEGELGGLVDLALEVGRVLDARHLQQDAVVALAHDGRLDGAGLVDAAAQDLDRLVDHFLLAAEQVLVGEGEPDGVAAAATRRARDRRRGSPRSPWRAAPRRAAPRSRRAPPCTVTSLKPICCLRSSPRTESDRLVRRSFSTERRSASSRKWAPPRRSRPRLMRLCWYQPGSWSSTAARQHVGQREQHRQRRDGDDQR